MNRITFPFTKVHGLGNDFVLIDPPYSSFPLTPADVAGICDRHRGIGADGLLLVLPGEAGAARMRIVNADGSVAEMCGNGIRCFARHLALNRGVGGDEIVIDTDAGPRTCLLRRDPRGAVIGVRVAMGAPRIAAHQVPLRDGLDETRRFYTLDGISYGGRALSMGNPHLALFVDRSDDNEAQRVGRTLTRHSDFPEGTNVEFVIVRGARELDVRVFERGVGLTLACGTGACAAAVAACLEGRVAPGAPLTVNLPGGPAVVEVDANYEEVWIEGPATEVFTGQYVAPRDSTLVRTP